MLCGCALGPNYKRPPTHAPESFRFATARTTNSLADLPWRDVFADPYLQKLISTALTNNYDIRQAVARVEESRYAAMAARSPLFPQVNYGGDLGRGKNALFNTPFNLNGGTASSALAAVNATWEIDFWGRIRRMSQAAQAQYLATDEARRGVTITLISDVATDYYQLLNLDQVLQIYRQATNDYTATFRVFNSRFTNGVASKLELDRVDADLAGSEAAIPQTKIQIATTENQIDILLGRNPGPIQRDSLTNQPRPELEIPVGLPSDLVRRRPDVLEAEQSLIAANATVGANLANFFPRIGLTSFYGRASPALSTFTAGTANLWNIGVTVTGPLFEGGQLYAQYKGSKASFVEAGAAYQQSVITAFQEVSDALITRQELADVNLYQAQQVTALSSSVKLATQRYVQGISSYYEVLEAQQQLYPAQIQEVQALSGEWYAIIELYAALGGGWPPDSK